MQFNQEIMEKLSIKKEDIIYSSKDFFSKIKNNECFFNEFGDIKFGLFFTSKSIFPKENFLFVKYSFLPKEGSMQEFIVFFEDFSQENFKSFLKENILASLKSSSRSSSVNCTNWKTYFDFLNFTNIMMLKSNLIEPLYLDNDIDFKIDLAYWIFENGFFKQKLNYLKDIFNIDVDLVINSETITSNEPLMLNYIIYRKMQRTIEEEGNFIFNKRAKISN